MMSYMQRASIVLNLINELRERDSWCGETHVQKATYLLQETAKLIQETAKIPLSYEYQLYKHGPFSFDLRDALTELRADDLVDLVPQPYPYGPKFQVTSSGQKLEKQFQKTLEQYRGAIQCVADVVSDKGVVELEKLSTAMYVTNEYDEGASPDDRAHEINRLKPHVSFDDALVAVEAIDKFIEYQSG